jgi:hypothetical protein
VSKHFFKTLNAHAIAKKVLNLGVTHAMLKQESS